MRKYKFNLLAIDVIDGLDNNFYVIDVNGILATPPILKYKDCLLYTSDAADE